MKLAGNASARIVDAPLRLAAIGCGIAIHTVIANAPDLTNLDKSP